MYNALNQILPLNFFSISPAFVFFGISHLAPPALNCSSTPSLFLASHPQESFLSVLSQCSSVFLVPFHVSSFSVSISFLISLVYWLLWVCFNKHKLIGFRFHLQTCEIDGLSLIMNRYVCWKDSLLLNWLRAGKKRWWKCIAYGSCSVK